MQLSSRLWLSNGTAIRTAEVTIKINNFSRVLCFTAELFFAIKTVISPAVSR